MSAEQTLKVKNFVLSSGVILPDAEFEYRTWGDLGSPVVLVFHPLTGNSNAAEWWDGIIGEGKLLDPKNYFIICSNFLGSCSGSSGPESINSQTGLAYRAAFPTITTGDIALQNLAILHSLGITEVSLGIGGSMGGMVLLELAAYMPDLFQRIIAISISDSHSAWRLAFSSVIRKTIEAFGKADAEKGLESGLQLARQIAMTSYRCSAEFDGRFGRDKNNNRFEIENYLEHHGEKIIKRFSPFSYITLTKAMEEYDIRKVIGDIRAKVLFIGTNSDILYSEKEIRGLASRLKNAEYQTLDAPFGHDSFLVAQDKLAKLIKAFLLSKQQKNQSLLLETY
ncbi:MAG: homoserine O-acetyltransferase [Ignavibacteriota bacterium]